LNGVALSETVIGPPCPKCQSPHSERLEFSTERPFHVYRCFQCGHIWRLPVEPPTTTAPPKIVCPRCHSAAVTIRTVSDITITARCRRCETQFVVTDRPHTD